MTRDDRLIARYIREDPHLEDEAEVRLADSLVHVWAIVGQLKVDDWDVSQVARDYDIPEIEVEAALAYYRRHKEALEARLADHVFVPASALAPAGAEQDVPHLYFDHDTSNVVAGGFRDRGEAITTAKELGLGAAMDGLQLLTAARRGWLLITHDQTHDRVLHDAWFRWGAAWGVPQSHSGIVVLPHGSPSFVDQLLVASVATFSDFTNKLFEWRPTGGWQIMDYRP